MKFLNKVLLILFAFFWLFTFKTQLSSAPVFRVALCVKKIDTIIDTELINIQVSVESNKKGYLENLTSKNFELYNDKTLQKIEFLSFDKSSNQYNIGFYPKNSETEEKQHQVKLKVKLSDEEKKEFGKVTVSRRKWILSARKN